MSIHSKLGTRLTAVVGGGFALTLALAACGGGTDTPEGAVENFFDNGVEDFATSFSEGDFDELTSITEEYFCEQDVSDIQEMADMAAEMSDEEREMALDSAADEFEIPEDWSYEIGEVTEDGDSATVELEVTENGETTDSTVDLVKEEDEWKICGGLGV
ncbi:Rv0361 family membrane protein [Glycomyces xiaoerkulensis]|uniref:Rv0361 family membrane protein n=1 Tax=Glycomyces xiaoerkulensis TaxID=2038139 RepID=UPI000C25C58F|nr:DUF4878 domain-containing protein [Glycomyces xiaoerkulensis]